MQKKIREYSYIYYIVATTAFFLILSSVCAFFSQRTFGEACGFSAYQVCCMLVPGLACAHLLKVDENKSGLESLFLGYLLGYCNNILVYYLLYFIGGLESNRIAYLISLGIQFILSVIYLSRKKIKYHENNSNWIIAIIAFLVVFLVELFTYSGVQMLPPLSDGGNVWGDVKYWLGNTISLKIGYPPIDFRTLREGHGYHFFSSMQLAMQSTVTGIPAAELSICFSFIQPIALLVGGIYCLNERYIKKPVYSCITYFLLLFTSGYEGITRVSYVSHMYISQYGFDYGMGIMLFLLVALVDFAEGEFDWRQYCYINLLFLCLLGTKAPFACIAIVGIGLCCFYHLVKGKWKKAIIQGVTALLIFFLIYNNVCSIEGYSGVQTPNVSESASEAETSLATSVEAVSTVVHVTSRHWDACENLQALRERVFQNTVIPTILLEIFFFALFVYLCNPCLLVLAFGMVLVSSIKNRRVKWLDMICIAMIAVGMLIALYIHMNGKSNVYFAMATYPVALLLFCRNVNLENGKTKKVQGIIIACMLIYGFNLFLNHAAYKPIKEYWLKGKEFFEIAQEATVYTAGDLNPHGVTKSEYEALCYIKNYADRNDSSLSFNTRREACDLTGICAEHKFLNMNIDDFKQSTIDLEQQIDQFDIKYLLYQICEEDVIDISGEVVFENEEWRVVRISPSA